jgi:hypothetical protein
MTKYTVLIFWLGLLAGMVGAEFSEAPYLYYYSHALNGIVIERADGTDSRIVGQGLIRYPKQVFAVSGPGWSPDGRWFAWRTAHHWEWDEGAAVSSDGKKSLELLRKFACIYAMNWSPDSRYLLVWGIVERDDRALECNLDGMPRDFWLIDVNTGAKAAVFTGIEGYFSRLYNVELTLDWSATDVQFNISEVVGEDNQYTMAHVSMGYDGTVVKTPIEQGHDLFEWSGIIDGGFPDKFVSSPDGHYQTTEIDYQMKLLDTQTDQIIELPWHSSPPIEYPIYLGWHPSGEWAVVGYEFCASDCGGIVGNVSVFNPATGLYRQLSDCTNHPTCIGWLPPQVHVATLPAGHRESVLMPPTHMVYESDEMKSSLGWLHEQATHQLACDKQERDSVPWTGEMTQVQTLDGQDIFTISDNFPCVDYGFRGPMRYDTAAHAPAVLVFSPNGRYAALVDNDHFVELYYAGTGTHARIATLNISAFELWFSEDSRRLYTRSRFAVAEWDVAELIIHARVIR